MRESVTAISVLIPINHPLNMVGHKIAPSIATNNCMVCKPTELTPLTCLTLIQKEGAEILFHPGREGALLPPIVIDRVLSYSELVMQETCGPIITTIRLPDDDDAVMAISNSTEFGLSSGICTNNLNRTIAYINGLDVGTCNIREQPGYRIEMLPFGGIKDSGNGVKEGVTEAMNSSLMSKYTPSRGRDKRQDRHTRNSHYSYLLTN